MTVMPRVAALVVLAASVVLIAPATASALPADDAFLDALGNRGIAYTSQDFVLSTAHDVCDQIDNGASFGTVLDGLSGITGDLPSDKVVFLAGASIASYCPWNVTAIPG